MAQTVQCGAELDPEEVGELVANAVHDETFLVLPEPEMHAQLVRRRAADLNALVASRLADAASS